MTSPALDLVLRGGGLSRDQFKARLLTILGDTRLLWMPRGSDTTTNTTEEAIVGRTVTYDATVAARLTALKNGYAQGFAGASSQYGTTPDTADMSFGNGTTDSAFSVVALINGTDIAAIREIISKNDTGQSEWQLFLTTGDALRLTLQDQSASVSALSTGPTIAEGIWTLVGSSYSGLGGTTAADGVSFFVNGAPAAATPTNNVSYVAMENLTAAIEIGSITAHTSSFFNGSMAMIAVCAKNLSAGDHAAIARLCRRHFGVPT